MATVAALCALLVVLTSLIEALNGLLLIGWSASCAYIAMERFWSEEGARR